MSEILGRAIFAKPTTEIGLLVWIYFPLFGYGLTLSPLGSLVLGDNIYESGLVHHGPFQCFFTEQVFNAPEYRVAFN